VAAPLNPTPLSRAIVGTILALTCYVALRKLALGIAFAVDPAASEWWTSPIGIITVQGLQAAAVLLGALIAASGQAKGSTVGGIVGVACGGAFLGYEILAGADPRELGLYLHTPVLAIVGGLAGLVGAWIWKAPPKLALVASASSKLSSLALKEVAEAQRVRPTVWTRVLVGTMVTVVAIVAAGDIRTVVQKYSGGILHVNSAFELRFVVWQIAALIGLGGAMLAGANTGIGTRQGFYTGLFSGLGVYALCMKAGFLFPALDFWLEQLGIPTKPVGTPVAAATIIGSVFFLGLVGGWMGGALFQPLDPQGTRRRVRGGMD
jgi:hypothetical protein